MDDRIGLLRCRYRILPGGDGGTARLDRLVTGPVADAWSRALGDRFEEDRAVLVVRHLRAHVVLDPTVSGDASLARMWGDRLAETAVRTIAHDPGDGANLVRFDDQAHFVACFVADVLRGVAWDRWYFGAFRPYRASDPGDVVAAVLRDHERLLATILAHLERSGALPDLLARLHPAVLAGLWEGVLRTTTPTPGGEGARHEEWRALVTAALRLAGDAGWLRASATDATEVLDGWSATQPGTLDWADPAALADAVADVLRWLVASGRARPAPGTPDPEGLRAALGDLDWLDTPRLAGAIRSLAGPPKDPALPTRPATVATPRTRALLESLTLAVAEHLTALDHARPTAPANALRLLAALAARRDGIADDPAIHHLLRQVLEAWQAVRESPEPSEVLSRMAAGDIDGAGAALGADVPAPLRTSVRSLARTGPPAAAVVARLAGGADAVSDAGSRTLHSPCAGVWLLLRTVRDTRLAERAAAAAYPPAGPGYLLAALGRRWAGASGLTNGRLDPALALLAGLDDPPERADLRAVWEEVTDAAHGRWEETMTALLRDHAAVGLPGHGGTGRVTRMGDLRADPTLFGPAGLGLTIADHALDLTAAVLVRIWARWLRGFETSTTGYLLRELVRRGGRCTVRPHLVEVELEQRPLDPVLELAGYLRALEPLPGTTGPRVTFRLRDVP